MPRQVQDRSHRRRKTERKAQAERVSVYKNLTWAEDCQQPLVSLHGPVLKLVRGFKHPNLTLPSGTWNQKPGRPTAGSTIWASQSPCWNSGRGPTRKCPDSLLYLASPSCLKTRSVLAIALNGRPCKIKCGGGAGGRTRTVRDLKSHRSHDAPTKREATPPCQPVLKVLF